MRFIYIAFLSSLLIPLSHNDINNLISDDMLDMGLNWNNNSIDKNRYYKDTESDRIHKNIGIIGRTGYFDMPWNKESQEIFSTTIPYDNGSITISPYIYLRANYLRYLDFELYIRGTNNNDGMKGYSGIERDISRLGLNSAEVDISTIGISNNSLSISYGRNRKVWGHSYNDNIILSSYSPSYESFNFSINSKNKYRYNYFYGFLESKFDTDSQANNTRYISGKFIEYSNSKNFIVSAGELVTFYGEDRGIDLSYLNPISFHLELENNQRTAVSGGNTENAIWFLYLDSFLMNKFRISVEAIADEFQFDRKDREEGRGDALGVHAHLSWYKRIRDYNLLLNLDYISIGTYTYQHQNGLTNFVTRNRLLGYSIGNDMDRFSLTAKIISNNKRLYLVYSHLRVGNNNLHNSYYQPYESFYDVEFPSEPIHSEDIITARLIVLGKKYYNFMLDAQYFILEGFSNYASIRLSLNFFID